MTEFKTNFELGNMCKNCHETAIDDCQCHTRGARILENSKSLPSMQFAAI